jgi:hypothetical protein
MAVEESLGTIRTLISNYEKRVADDALVDELCEGQSHGVTRRASYAVARGDRRALLADLNSWATAALQRQEQQLDPTPFSGCDGSPESESEAMASRLRRVVGAFRSLGSRLMELATRYEDTASPGANALSSDAQSRVELDALKLERALLLAKCNVEDYDEAAPGASHSKGSAAVQVVERIPPELLEAHEALVTKLEDQLVQLKSRNAYLAAELDDLQTQTAAFKVERELMLGTSGGSNSHTNTDDAETWTGPHLTQERGVNTGSMLSVSDTGSVSMDIPEVGVLLSPRSQTKNTTPSNAKGRRSADLTALVDTWRSKFRSMQLLFMALRLVTASKARRQAAPTISSPVTAPPPAQPQASLTSPATSDGDTRRGSSVIPTRKLATAALPRSSASGGNSSNNIFGFGTLIQVNDEAENEHLSPSAVTPPPAAVVKQPPAKAPAVVTMSIVRPGGAIKSASKVSPQEQPAPSPRPTSAPTAPAVRRPKKQTVDFGVNTEMTAPAPREGFSDAAVNTPHSTTWQHQAKQYFPLTKKAAATQTSAEEDNMHGSDGGDLPCANVESHDPHVDLGAGGAHGAVAVTDVRSRPRSPPTTREPLANSRIFAYPMREAVNGAKRQSRPQSAQTPSSIPRVSQTEQTQGLVAFGLNIPVPAAAAAAPEAVPYSSGAPSMTLSTAAVEGSPVSGSSSHHFSTVRIQSGAVEVQQVEEYLIRTHCLPTKPPSLSSNPPRQSAHFRQPQYILGLAVPMQRPATAGRVLSGS